MNGNLNESNFIEMNKSENQVIEIDGICFQTIMQNYQPVIMVNQKHKQIEGKVELGIGITNNTMTPFRFSKHRTMIPEVIQEDGKVLRPDCLYGRRYAKEFDLALALPGKSVTLLIESRVIKIDDREKGSLKLSIPFSNRFSAPIYLLEDKKKQFRWIYENQNPTKTVKNRDTNQIKTLEGLWVGQVFTPWLELNFTQ